MKIVTKIINWITNLWTKDKPKMETMKNELIAEINKVKTNPKVIKLEDTVKTYASNVVKEVKN